MYIGGGFADGGVLVCEVRDLLQSAELATPQPATSAGAHSSHVWRKIPELPVVRSSLISLQDQLLAIGGKIRSEYVATSEVRQYDVTTNSWSVVGHMHMQRYQSLAAVLPNNRVMVVGGFRQIYAHTNHLEIASVVH